MGSSFVWWLGKMTVIYIKTSSWLYSSIQQQTVDCIFYIDLLICVCCSSFVRPLNCSTVNSFCCIDVKGGKYFVRQYGFDWCVDVISKRWSQVLSHAAWTLPRTADSECAATFWHYTTSTGQLRQQVRYYRIILHRLTSSVNQNWHYRNLQFLGFSKTRESHLTYVSSWLPMARIYGHNRDIISALALNNYVHVLII